MFVIVEPYVRGAIEHKNRPAPRFPSSWKTRTQTVRQSQDSSLLVAIETEWRRADIFNLIVLLKRKLITECEHFTRLADTNLVSANNVQTSNTTFS